MDLIERLTNVDKSKGCLLFLSKRILDPHYRGVQISQHNRYTVNDVITILEELYKITGMNKLTIRNTDLKKRPSNTPEEYKYAEYTNNVAKKMERCTQDSLRKNLFVDLNRMGLIDRYDKNEDLVEPYTKKGIRFVSLTQQGLELIKSKNSTFKRNFYYTKAIDTLSNGLANDLLNVAIMINDNRINIYEFMFFVSYTGKILNGHYYTKDEIVEFVKEYRSLSRFQRDEVISIVQEYCNPKNFAGNKTEKRDFHNWKNEAQQIFMLMDQTVILERGIGRYSDELFVKVGDDAIFQDQEKLERSKRAKDEYFKNHNIVKKIGFELHHIIPLKKARSRLEFASLDVWENMVYIDGYTHGKISQQGSRHTILNFIGKDIKLIDYTKRFHPIFCKHIENVEYNPIHQDAMKTYNIETIQSIKGY